MKVGILTGGGDCPGLNAVIRAAIRKGVRGYGHELIGFLDGWQGVVDQRFIEMDVETTRGKLPIGGTILGTSRYQPYMDPDGVERTRQAFNDIGLDVLIAIGGEGTLGCARDLAREGFPIVGVPKTIDNDISGTEMTFGFQTAVQICTDAIDRLHTTAESHDRVMVVEVMGRHAGHIAVWAGIAGGATVTLIPEAPFDIDDVCEAIVRRHEGDRFASVIVVAEGARPAEGTIDVPEPSVDIYGHKRLGGIGSVVGAEIERRTGYETRVTILGHVQRGGTPVAFDRVLATRYGVAAMELAHEGAYGDMVCLRDGAIGSVSLDEAKDAGRKVVDPQLYDVAKVFWAESPNGQAAGLSKG